MMDLLLSRFAFQHEYLQDLLRNIPDDRMDETPATGINTPSWIVGHLCWAADLIPGLVGQSSTLDPSWASRFSMKTRPAHGGLEYPSKSALAQTLSETHANAARTLQHVDINQLRSPFPEPAFRHIMPTVADAIAHLLTTT